MWFLFLAGSAAKQAPTQYVPGILSPGPQSTWGVKLNHSLPSSTKLKNDELTDLTFTCTFTCKMQGPGCSHDSWKSVTGEGGPLCSPQFTLQRVQRRKFSLQTAPSAHKSLQFSPDAFTFESMQDAGKCTLKSNNEHAWYGFSHKFQETIWQCQGSMTWI